MDNIVPPTNVRVMEDAHSRLFLDLAMEILGYLPVNVILTTVEHLPSILNAEVRLVSLDSQYKLLCLNYRMVIFNIYYMETRPIHQRRRSLSTVLEESEMLRLSAILPHREGSEKAPNRHGHINPNNSHLANPSLVSKSASNKHKKSDFDSQNKQLLLESGLPRISSCCKQNTAASGVGGSRKILFAEGQLEQAALLISDCRRKITINHYNLVGRIGNDWCCERPFDPIRCDVNPVLEFLTELIHSGLENNTNCNCTSAVPTHFETIHPFVVE